LLRLKKIKFLFFYSALLCFVGFRVDASGTISDTTHTEAHATTAEDHSAHDGHDHGNAAGHDAHGEHSEFDPAATATHHIGDANTYTILELFTIPLPMILYRKDKGFEFFMSSKLAPDPHHHEDGKYAYNGYVMKQGNVYRVEDTGFPMEGQHEVASFSSRKEKVEDKERDVQYIKYQGKEYKLAQRSTWDGGVLGGGITSFYDFSITKNVLAMFLVAAFLLWMFIKAAKSYVTNAGKAPSGVQNLLEPVVEFIRDDVAIPFIGEAKYKKYLPFLLSVFFFILGLNLFGQIPFFGGINATGNISLTMVLAILVFIIVNINGNKHYWAHIFWMPGVNIPMKILLAIIEGMSLFIKPLTLMLRLAGNISAGHIAIISFIGLIFIFGKSGESLVGAGIGSIISVPLTMFMMALELIVAFIQAFVFTILTASYIGAATEDAHHGDAHHGDAHH
jgi:F-type H+-transporting ATPase subunit a